MSEIKNAPSNQRALSKDETEMLTMISSGKIADSIYRFADILGVTPEMRAAGAHHVPADSFDSLEDVAERVYVAMALVDAIKGGRLSSEQIAQLRTTLNE